MSDFLVIDSGGSNPYQTTEHYLRRVLAGDVQSVRLRLVSALERIGYDVIDDDDMTIRGRRGAAGWAAYFASADVLDYPRTLVVKLKPAGEHATRATFDYVIKHPSLSTGEKAILTREAEAISSLATVRKIEKLCPACGTESTDDSRFCRQCGTPMTFESSDLELLNMAAEIRAGYTSVVTSEIVNVAAMLGVGSAIFVLKAMGAVVSPAVWTILVFTFLLLAVNVGVIGFGWNRMSRSLRRKSKSESLPVPAEILSFPLASASRQFDAAAPPSVIEATTSLLDDNHPPQTKPLAAAEIPQKRTTLSDLDRLERG